ncbi:hypothetical protein C8Q75DRAFT_792855 [Abortiporus biennis]|nr:hypothetical protein C8Q75DRAFT_792855 [Abortiporus biennis]
MSNHLRAFSSTLSAVHRGTAFEERSLRILHDNLSMSLRRVGGKSDGGIDLQGWWWVPTNSHSQQSHHTIHGVSSSPPRKRIRVLAQCKDEKKKMAPKYVREMEGVLHRFVADSSWTQQSTTSLNPITKDSIVGLLISSSPFSKATLIRIHSSPIPFCALYLPHRPNKDAEEECESDPNELGSIIFNPALCGSDGPLGGEIEARWEHCPDNINVGRPGLWWNGVRIASWIPDTSVVV